MFGVRPEAVEFIDSNNQIGTLMKNRINSLVCAGAVSIMATVFSPLAAANGAIGDHVNDMKAHLGQYTEEVHWIIEKVDGIVDRYEEKGQKAAKAETVVDIWEEVDFHSAIETNYVPIYASIWQGLFGVKGKIDAKAPVAEVRAEQEKLEDTLWQALGAVRLAAHYQAQGLLPEIKTTETEPTTPVETVDDITHRLDRVVAKYAEKLNDVATSLVHDTYLYRFEGIEGMLIEQDANLVTEMEKYFNVTLPLAIKDNKSVDEVRSVVEAMKAKLDTARALLVKAEKDRKDVF